MHKELEKLRKDLQKDIVVGGPTAPNFESASIRQKLRKVEEKNEDEEKDQRTLGDFGPKKAEAKNEPVLKLIADTREFKSSVVRHLATWDVVVESKQLDIGDYLVSERVGVERKEVDDFLGFQRGVVGEEPVEVCGIEVSG